MTVPYEYNSVSLSVNASEVFDTGQALESAAEDIGNALESIDTTLGKLQLGWDGTSAAEAKDFSDQWTAAMLNLFGSQKDPSQGVLNQAVTTLLTAGGNYGAAEQAIVSMFAAMSSSLTTATASGSDVAPIPAGNLLTDGSLSALGEINWTAVG